MNYRARKIYNREQSVHLLSFVIPDQSEMNATNKGHFSRCARPVVYRCLLLVLLTCCAVTLVFYGIRTEYFAIRFRSLHFFSKSGEDGEEQWASEQQISDKERMEFQLINNSSREKLKTILLWNGVHRIEMSIFGMGHDAFVVNNCPVSNCYITNKSSLIPVDDYDAILFNMSLLFAIKDENKRFPSKRKPKQRYVYFSIESPFYNKEDLSKYDGFFNWTMSFQNYSDIPLRYGRIERIQGSTFYRYYQPTKTKNKTKLIAWFSSHCNPQSKRDTYVKELQKHIPVDVYGSCGSLKCGRERGLISKPHCHEMLSTDYKFYLSFENSLCKDYVTEKFYAILHQEVVPIVMGRANYSDIAPPHSFIDALQYNSPKELADYLYLLDANQTLYNEYFKWKTDYKVYSGYRNMTREAYCLLCEKLNKDDKIKIYEDMVPDWSPSTQCIKPQFPWLKG